MNVSVNKLAPSAIVFAAIGYCCWPYIFMSTSRTAATNEMKLPEITKSILSPDIQADTGRDPFGMQVVIDRRKAEEERIKKIKSGNKKLDKDGKPIEIAKKKAEPEPYDPFPTFMLNATLISGQRHYAVINGQTYREGEPVAQPASAAEPYMVVKVLRNQVLLERFGKSVFLKYPDKAAAAEVAKSQSSGWSAMNLLQNPFGSKATTP